MLSFGKIGRAMLPEVDNAFCNYEILLGEMNVGSWVTTNVTTLLLSASIFSDYSWKWRCLYRAANLLKRSPDEYLSAWLTLRVETVARQSSPAASAIPESSRPRANSSDHRVTAIVQELRILEAEKAVDYGDLESALEMMKGIRLSESQSQNHHVIRHGQYQALLLEVKILCFKGNFGEAKKLLCENTTGEDLNSHSFAYTHRYAHICCEMGMPEAGINMARETLHDVQHLKRGGRSARLALSIKLAECLLQAGDLNQAETDFIAAKQSSKSIAPVPSLQIEVGLARIHQLRQDWQNAQRHWRNCLELIAHMPYPWKYVQMMVFLSLAVCQAAQSQPFQQYLDLAKSDGTLGGKQYWLVGLGTTWYDHITDALAPLPLEPRRV